MKVGPSQPQFKAKVDTFQKEQTNSIKFGNKNFETGIRSAEQSLTLDELLCVKISF